MYRRDAVRHDVLVSLSGLEIVWREAHDRCRGTEPGTLDHDLWREALDKLVVALQEAETVASAAVPSVGRRHWADRTPDDPRDRQRSVVYLDDFQPHP